MRLFAPWLKGGRADGRDYLSRADELAQKGWHGLALWDYNATVRRFPKLKAARMHRGLELFRRGSWQAAADDFKAVLEGAPNDSSSEPAKSRLSWAYLELGRPADAAAELVELLDASPSSWRNDDRAGLLLLRAEYFDRVGKPDQAKADRNLAAKLFPKLAYAANKLAWQWLMPKSDQTPQENWRLVPASLLLARKAVELDPHEPLYLNTLGVVLYLSGEYHEAKAVLEASLESGKGNSDAFDLFPLAVCHQRLGDGKAARDCYDRAVAWVGAHETSLNFDRREVAILRAEARQVLGLSD